MRGRRTPRGVGINEFTEENHSLANDHYVR